MVKPQIDRCGVQGQGQKPVSDNRLIYVFCNPQSFNKYLLIQPCDQEISLVSQFFYQSVCFVLAPLLAFTNACFHGVFQIKTTKMATQDNLHHYTPHPNWCNNFDIMCECVNVWVCVCLSVSLSWPNGQTYRPEFWHEGQVGGYLGQVSRSRS